MSKTKTKTATALPPLKRIIQSWDTAFKSGAQNDYSVGTTWGEAENGFYLLDRWKGRCEFPELKRRVAASAAEWKPSAILIEDKASGQSLIQELKQSTPFPVLAVKVDTDKISRASASSPLVEAGKVFLPKDAPWLADYLYSLSVFPAGAHDDDVDSTTQALNWMRGSNHTYGLLDFYKEVASNQGTLAQQVHAMMSPKAAPDASPTSEEVPGCPQCESTFIQTVPSGKRCGRCGYAFPFPQPPVDPRQVRTW